MKNKTTLLLRVSVSFTALKRSKSMKQEVFCAKIRSPVDSILRGIIGFVDSTLTLEFY